MSKKSKQYFRSKIFAFNELLPAETSLTTRCAARERLRSRFPFRSRQGRYNVISDNRKTMFLTNVLLKKVKSKHTMVLMESMVSGHKYNVFRERLADKLELVHFDPWIGRMSVYKERRKIRSANVKRFTEPT